MPAGKSKSLPSGSDDDEVGAMLNTNSLRGLKPTGNNAPWHD